MNLDKSKHDAAVDATDRLMRFVVGLDLEVAQVALANTLASLLAIQHWENLDELEKRLPGIADAFVEHIRVKIKSARGRQA